MDGFADQEIAALLGRAVRPFDEAACGALLQGRRVLITGAGGSVGGALARHASTLGCARLSLLDNNPGALFEIRQSTLPNTAQHCDILCDVRDRAGVRRWIAREAPDLVIHAAAVKHVDIAERHRCEATLTNTIGAWNVAEAVADLRPGATMVLISTDKAAQVRNVMGASKRAAELAVAMAAARAAKGPDPARFAAVRFGNVFGSSNSVAQIFARQIAAGGPLTVTHPEMLRYFMTAGEACQLVLQAVGLIEHGPRRDYALYALELGSPIRILDLARRMADMAAERTGKRVAIVETEMRDGETLTESLVGQDERATHEGLDGVMRVERLNSRPLDLDALAALEHAARAGEDEAIILLLDEIIQTTPPLAEALRT